jgi:glycosyltransferase involved in cell wall biosynthesis
MDRVDQAIVISRSGAGDLMDCVRISEEKVTVVLPGARAPFRALDFVDPRQLSRIGLEGEYILAVGSNEPRKNLERLLRAFRTLKESGKIPHRLAIVGPAGWKNEGMRRALVDLKLEREVVFTGYVEDSDLNVLYNGAALLVYPSLYEGFGLPPLEAMAAGCPVAVSRASSLPEVVGEAGLYFDPLNIEEMADVMRRIIESQGLRSDLVERGHAQAHRFTWESAASEARRVYARAIETRGRTRI